MSKRDKSVGRPMSPHELGVYYFDRLARPPWDDCPYPVGSAEFQGFMRGYFMAVISGHTHAEYDHTQMIGGDQ